MDLPSFALPASSPRAHSPFPVVGIGASAGGLPALIALLGNMPEHPGMALVVVLHLAPDSPSMADQVLQRATRMPVEQVIERTCIRADHVYVIAPGCSLRIRHGTLQADRLVRSPGDPVTIDEFLRTLADAHGEGAIGIVLSGMGADGVAGLAAIRTCGGITMAQLPADAEHASMPASVIGAGLADFILPAAHMPAKLVALRDLGRVVLDETGAGPVVDQLLALLRDRTRHDFGQYERSSVLRRLARRLQVRGVGDLARYYQLLETDPHELEALRKELLIGVSAFFRDGDAFDALERILAPRLFGAGGAQHDREAPAAPQSSVRAWVAGCSTGEEAYSLAMLLADHAPSSPGGAYSAIQVLASDVDERSIGVARAGRYPAALAADLAPAQLARLQRYFTLDGDHYQAGAALRDRILFTPHNLLHDPAFPKLDLIICRNVLTYLNRDVQRHMFALFHGALNPGGYLFLGSAETAGVAAHLFAPVDARHRIYQALGSARTARHPGAAPSCAHAPLAVAGPAGERGARTAPFADIHARTLLEMAAPSVLVDAHGDILHASDHVGPFLHYAPGEPARDILLLVLPVLRPPLRSALLQAARTALHVSAGPVRYHHNGVERMVLLSVQPVEDAGGGQALMLVQFDDAGAAPALAPTENGQQQLVQQLDEELHFMSAGLRRAAELAAVSSANTRSANIELLARLQELRATMAGSESGNLALLARNQELCNLNAALARGMADAARANDDLSNLIASTDIATLFLDRDMRIQRLTPHVVGIFNVIPADIGRPLAHITHTLDYHGLFGDIATVLATAQPTEWEARSTSGRAYIVRIHPYRTAAARIEGVVLTFFDNTSRRHAQEARRAAQAQLAEELAGARLLQDLSCRLIGEEHPETLHEPILEAAMALMKSDAATIQLLDPERASLRLLSARNIAPQSCAHWEWVDVGHASSCGRVLATCARVIVEDVEASVEMAGTRDLEEYRRSGIRAVQSTPLTERSGHLIGMLSTHWHAPRRFGPDDFNLFDVLARQLSDLLVRALSTDALRRREAAHSAEPARHAAGCGADAPAPQP